MFRYRKSYHSYHFPYIFYHFSFRRLLPPLRRKFTFDKAGSSAAALSLEDIYVFFYFIKRRNTLCVQPCCHSKILNLNLSQKALSVSQFQSFFTAMTGCYEICKFGNNIFETSDDAKNFADNAYLYFLAHSLFTISI